MIMPVLCIQNNVFIKNKVFKAITIKSVHYILVSASDGPLAKRLMHIAHLSGNTSGVSKSSSD